MAVSASTSGLLCNMTLTEYIQYCCTGQLPQKIRGILNGPPSFLKDLLCALDIIGALEPLSATRPGACDPAAVVDKDIFVKPATLNPDGSITPSEERVTAFCAPMNRALVIQESRVTAANLTAETQPHTQPLYKRVNIGTFGEWCLPFEPIDEAGQFVNIEHVVIPPKAGFSIYVQNFDPTSVAHYHFHARMWASC